jgi:hypothetical protein
MGTNRITITQIWNGLLVQKTQDTPSAWDYDQQYAPCQESAGKKAHFAREWNNFPQMVR